MIIKLKFSKIYNKFYWFDFWKFPKSLNDKLMIEINVAYDACFDGLKKKKYKSTRSFFV